ncbi:MAG TPA: tetratricopeptide repeat protein [Sphingomicrobium sp.]|nr:tetratricopeptide repeat protein [Sphingomicrobium sp.]
MPAVHPDGSKEYVAARAASISGDHATAAELYARLATTSSDSDLRQRAISEAINAGDMPLALRLIRQVPNAPLSIDSKLLLVADALKRGDNALAARLLDDTAAGADLSFWVPLVDAWSRAERRDLAGAMAVLANVPRGSAFFPFVDEENALLLLKFGKTAEAEPYARRAIGKAGAREYRLRLALAAAFAAAGDQARSEVMLEGISGDTTAVRRAIQSGAAKTLIIDTPEEAFSEQLIALAIEMRRSQNGRGSPVQIAQIARFAAPGNSSAAVLLGGFLSDRGRLNDALAVLRSVPASDPLKAEAIDAEARALIDEKRFDEALALANAAASRPSATVDDFARLGDVYGEMNRHNEAAAAYRQALDRSANAETDRVWPLLLLQASALESAGRWPEAKAALGAAIAMAPSEPLILNFLGYAKLEHGEDLDAAEALIRKASDLAPDNASITDSLGWALYKRGRIDEAIDILQRAAVGDPTQAEIQEHLGDALYAAGRHFEARYAWSAALATADEEVITRLKRKIESGLTKETAAP